MSKPRIVLTGGTGFVGKNLMEKMEEAGFFKKYEIYIPSRNPQKAMESIKKYTSANNFTLLKLSLLDKDSLKEFLRKIKPFMIIHLAGITKALKVKDFYLGNHTATKNLVESAPEETQFFLYLSSQAASRPGINVKEDEPESPVSHYGKSKLLAEKEVEKFRGNWLILRPVSIFGEGDRDFLRAIKIVQSLRINPIIADNRVSLIYVKDVASAIIHFSHKLMEGELSGEKVFLTSGYAPTTKELGDLWGDILNLKVISVKIPSLLLYAAALLSTISARIKRKPDVLSIYKVKEMRENWVASPEKMLSLGFKPHHFEKESVKEAWNKTIKWYMENGFLKRTIKKK